MPGSPDSRRSSFRDSVHLIPLPDDSFKRGTRFEPLFFRAWFAPPLYVIMIILAAAVEVALNLSIKNDGFSVPEKNVFSFVSAQFLSSFFPTLIVAPFAILVSITDFWLRLYQPYISLVRGDVPADESVLANYLALSRLRVLMKAVRHRHWIIYTSTILTFVALFFQPLGGSLFEIKQVYKTTSSQVLSTQSIALAPDVDQLTGFEAAAGFVQAAAYHNLSDPPFIMDGWATAEFQYPLPASNDVSVDAWTVGVQSSDNCFAAAETQLNLDNASGNYTLEATTDASFSTQTSACVTNVTFTRSTADRQYGVEPILGCATASVGADETDVSVVPVMFWFFHTAQDAGGSGQDEVRVVFCRPSIRLNSVLATVSLTNGSLLNVTKSMPYTSSNSVTGDPLNGRAYNGVIFPDNSDPFVQARSLAIRSGVPGAIMRAATQLPGGPETSFSNANGFLELTHKIYTQHLSMSADAVYFVAQNQTLDASTISLVPKLWVSELSAHLLAGLLASTGIIGLIIFFFHWKARRTLRLPACPGTIAATLALTSRSGFGELLYPYDDDKTLTSKLTPLHFRLDHRTGAVLAEECTWERNYDGKRASGSYSNLNSPRASRISVVGPDSPGGSPRGSPRVSPRASPRASRTSLALEEGTALLPDSARGRRLSASHDSASPPARSRRVSITANEDGTLTTAPMAPTPRTPRTPPIAGSSRPAGWMDRRSSSEEANLLPMRPMSASRPADRGSSSSSSSPALPPPDGAAPALPFPGTTPSSPGFRDVSAFDPYRAPERSSP